MQRRSDAARQYFTDHVVEPFTRMRDEVEQMMGDIPTRWPSPYPASRLATLAPFPAIEMTETDDTYKVSVEVPGVAPGEIDLSVQQDMLVIKGEKREEHEEKGRDFSRSERVYGSFERRLRLPDDARSEDIEASSRDGVLTIAIPRDSESRNAARHIPIKGHEAAK
ncbi:hypothetical protein AAV99_12670 [Aurantiacibacter marinus]|uniref:SHSP domain-containing protein n=1 Tax=Aurantiacibacter marinus TaxID=874156 RepID=A0A0H0XRX7_9SPHN|nr:hypothetical protein AAV99_12670 [Aurantiacibacter marinus]